MIVADDHPAMVEAICDTLAEEGLEIVGRAVDGEEALAKIEKRGPAVAVIDLRMPRISGIEAARRPARTAPDTAGGPPPAGGARGPLPEGGDARGGRARRHRARRANDEGGAWR